MSNDGEKCPPVLVSACLLGVRCRYDGTTNPDPELFSRIGNQPVLPVCPEQLGGLGTPRPAAELRNGSGEDVLDKRATVRVSRDDSDVSEPFVKGAREVELMARKFGVRLAILKSKSPSCGYGQVYRDGALVPGNGVTAASLARIGVSIISVDAPKQT